jgi:hypothetical protein
MPEHDTERSETQAASQPRTGFVKMMRSPDIIELIETSPVTFTLAAVIALRARYRSGISLKGLQPGESFLGDYRRCGLSRQQYRTAQANLAKWRFAEFRPTNKGTIAKLIDVRLFDVLNESGNQQTNQQPTNGQPLTNKGKKEKQEKNLTMTGGLARPSSGERCPKSGKALTEFAKQHDIPDETVFRFARYNNSRQWPLNDWRGALLAFQDTCDESSGGVSAVPSNWRPEIVHPDDISAPD